MINDQGRAHWYGPSGDSRIFEDGETVPDGWQDHPFPRLPQLDHDKDGKAGGSPRVEGDVSALRAAYKKKFGKKPFGGWDAATLKAKLA